MAQFGTPISPPEIAKRNAVFPRLDSYTDGTDRDIYPYITMDGSGYWIAIWQSYASVVYVRSTEGVCLDGFCTEGLHEPLMKPCVTNNGCRWTAAREMVFHPSPAYPTEFDPSVATDGQNNWVVLFGSMPGAFSDPQPVMAMRSRDNGESWLGPVMVAANGAQEGFIPGRDIDTDGQGTWVAAWHSFDDVDVFGNGTEGDIFFSRSTDFGETWSSVALLNAGAVGDDDYRDDTVQLATDGAGNWVAVWNTYKTPAVGGGVDMRYARSSDNGANWSAPALLNPILNGGNQYPRIATDRRGVWIAAWSQRDSGFGADSDIVYVRSTDKGVTWTSPTPLNSWAGADTLDDYISYVVSDSRGNWLVAWNNYEGHSGTGTDGDNWIVRSADYGVTWTVPDVVNVNATTDGGNDGAPAFATDQHGHWVAIWQSTETFFGTVGPDLEPLFAEFAFPDCNGNDTFRTDADDIRLGSSIDADNNGVPDECQGATTTDCQLPPNGNGIEDAMDISSGRSKDCNLNTIPDECEMGETCASPSCDDCNLNGLLDGCDLALGLADDVLINATQQSGTDGIPDNCDTAVPPPPPSATAGGCGDNWSCPDNWNLGGAYPQNAGFARYAPTLDTSASNLFMDIDTTLNALRLLNGAGLRFTQVGAAGNLLLERGGLLTTGPILAGDDRVMNMPGGTFELRGPTADYHRDAAASGTVGPKLLALDVRLSSANQFASQTAGLPALPTMTVDGTMRVEAYRDFSLEGFLRVADNAFVAARTGEFAVAAGGELSKLAASSGVTDAAIEARNFFIFGAKPGVPAGLASLTDLVRLDVSNEARVQGTLRLGRAAVVELPDFAGIAGVFVDAGGLMSKDEVDAQPSAATLRTPSLRIAGVDTAQNLPRARFEFADTMVADVTIGNADIAGELRLNQDARFRVAAGAFSLLADAFAQARNSSRLEAAAVHLGPEYTEAALPPERGFVFRDSASFLCAGDFRLEGQVPQVTAGVTPPPKANLFDFSSGSIRGDMVMTGLAEYINASAVPLSLGGSWRNDLVRPSLFDSSLGGMRLDGDVPQTFEVAGRDFGVSAEGYATSAPTLFDPNPSTNFSKRSLEVAAGRSVEFTNDVANTVGTGPCQEAQYLSTLELRAGATVILNNANVYCRNLIDEGATIQRIGCGDLILIPQPPPELVWNPDPNSTSRGTRSLSISTAATASGGSGTSAIRVELVDLQNPDPANPPCCQPQNFGAYESATCTALNEGNGCARWLGPAVSIRESQDNISLGTFTAARLQCSPYYTDWTTLGSIKIVGAEMMPSSTYELTAYGSSCKGVEATCTNVGTPVQALTRRSGDVSSPFAPSGTQPDPQDVVAVLNKFKSQPGSPSKSIAQIQPNVIELNVDVGALDIAATIDAFKGFAYPFSGPCPCPSLVTCNATVCSSPGVCSGGLCVKTCNAGTNAGQPCLNDTHCPSGTCPSTGFCRDRCGRCN